jgi:hypothetical protein
VTELPPPTIPWQVTGNHWLALPCIHPADASLHAVGVLHRGARAAIEFAGHSDFLSGAGPALLRPALRVNGERTLLSDGQMAWERAAGWLPTFTCTVGSLVVRGTLFAPYGRDADMAGAVYAIAVENRAASLARVVLSLEGMLGHRQQRVRTARPFDDAHRVARGGQELIVLGGTALPQLVALAIGADGPAQVDVGAGATPSFAIQRELEVAPGGREQAAFYIAAGPEHDGAEATVAVMRRRGWRDLLTTTRDALQALEQTTGNEGVDRIINRNLLFAYFFAVGRALDDAHYYLVRTRAPWHGRGLTVRDWEALSWTIPAVQLADAGLARELLLRACELHGYAPGRGVHYFDGTLFEPGFCLEGAAAYALAADRYIRDTGDDEIVDEPALADTLYLSADDLAARRDKQVPLYATEVSPSGAPVPHPFTLHANAAAAQALDVLRRTLDEETAREIQDPEAVRAAIRRHFEVRRDGQASLASAIDLAGNASAEDDPLASALWLPLYDAVERHDSLYRRTVRGIGAAPHHLAQQCARLIGPESAEVLKWLRRAPLDGGLAAELVDASGRVAGNGGDASLAGLLAWSAWYAVHALGARP